MPATPLFVHRLAQAIAAIQTLPGDLVDRRTLEEALGVSKWTAWRVMRRCGPQEGPGGALVCSRPALLAALEKMAQDGRYAPEIARRQRLSQYLDQIARFAGAHHKEIAPPEAAAGLRASRFASLPPGIDLSPTELRITFGGTEEFLQKFGAVVFALRNDFPEIERFIDGR